MRDQDRQAVQGVLAAGLDWLYETTQPDGAIITNNGLGYRATGRLRLSFAPMPAPVVVYIADAQYGTNPERTLRNPLTDTEILEVAALLEELGRPAINRWNGAGCDTGSFQLAGPIHPTLAAAAAKYREGCPDHTGPLCSWDGCLWFPTGNKLIVQPSWPSTAVADAA